MIELPLLAANWMDIAKALLPLVFLLIWVLGKIAEEKNKRPNPQGAPRPGPRPEPAGGKAAAGPDQRAADPIRAEVEEFLRRASGRDQPPPDKAQAPAKPASGIEILVNEPPARTGPLPSATPRPRSQGSTNRTAKSRPTGSGLSSSTRPVSRKPRKLTTQHLEERASHLGEQIAQADEKMASRLHTKFDHDLGQLAGRRAARVKEQTVEEKVTPASQIAGLLANPANIQQAIVLNEILSRPVDRWE